MRKNNLHNFSLLRRNLIGQEQVDAGFTSGNPFWLKTKPHSGKEQTNFSMR